MKKNIKLAILLTGISLVIFGHSYSQPRILSENLPKNIQPEVRQLIEKLYSEDPGERGKALIKLGEIGQKAVPAIPFIIGMLSDTKSFSVQSQTSLVETAVLSKEAIKVLTIIGQPAVGPLIKALRDRNSIVRKNAAEALGEIKDKSATDPLITALEDDDGTVRQYAAEALGKIGDNRALKPLTVALRDRKSKVQEGAREAIEKIIWDMKAKHLLSPLHASLKSRESVVRTMAAKALMELRDPFSVDALIEALNDDDAQVQRSAREALKRMGRPAVEPLTAFLRDDNPYLCMVVIKLLGEIGDNLAVGHLIGVLKHFRSWQLRSEAADALGKIKDPRIVGPLIEALNDRNSRVREAAAKSLKEVGEPAVEPLLASLKDENQDVSFKAIVLLGEIGDSRAVEPLVGVLKHFELWAMRFEAARSLGMIKDPRAIGPLTEALYDKDEYVREGAEGALKEIAGKEFKRRMEKEKQ
ncbi:MAG: HEAT repeat domain-containing protein [Thermodesulfovibrionales bacterium]|jgi:HEAT repeat protein